ncbi:porin [Variovorax sp. J22R133]|uniref:porin n=1 Tax=Variovorax brevis TaxID=3053503 RepID=UPI002575F3F6|nr:porin [Variovorax sp. J22R133]MDM0116924.1 porin [Variovorax sp. J22R133]
MNKKATLLACTFALTAGSTSAQSALTTYGLVDLGFVHESGGPNGASVNKLTSGVQSGSRLGFRGAEDLGGGLQGFFILEMGINADTGALGQGGLAFGRQSVVGLKDSALGSVILGRQYTPVANIQTETDPFTTGLAGDSANLISPGGLGGNNRMDNTLRYVYTHSSGFSADAVYGFGEVPDSNAKRQYGGAIGYVSGPIYAKLGYANVNVAQNVPAKMTFLGAKYNFGVATAHFNYVWNKGSAVFGLVNPDSQDLMVGLTVPIGAHQIMASYIHKDDKTAANNDAKQIALGYLYYLSKRTNFYSSVARIDNNAVAGAPTGFYRVGNATEQGLGDKAFNAGIRHVF